MITAVDVKTGASTFEAGSPTELFNPHYVNLQHPPGFHPFAVSADGQRFLIPLSPTSQDEATTAPIAVVLNWQAALGVRERR